MIMIAKVLSSLRQLKRKPRNRCVKFPNYKRPYYICLYFLYNQLKIDMAVLIYKSIHSKHRGDLNERQQGT